MKSLQIAQAFAEVLHGGSCVTVPVYWIDHKQGMQF